MTPLAAVERDAVIVACAISAGIHAGLTPDHFAESVGAGLGFAAATAGLAAFVAGLTLLPTSRMLLGTIALLGGLLASYALATTSGLPVLHPDPEPVDGLALFTKAVEAAGLLAAAHLLWRVHAVAPGFRQLKGTLT